jgi:hypothetical protein
MDNDDDKDRRWIMEIAACLEDTPSDSDDDADVKMASNDTILTSNSSTSVSAPSSYEGPTSTMQFPFFGSTDDSTSLQSISTSCLLHRLDSTTSSIPPRDQYSLQKGYSDSSIVTDSSFVAEVKKKAKKDTRTHRIRPKKSEKNQELKEKLASLIEEYNRRKFLRTKQVNKH